MFHVEKISSLDLPELAPYRTMRRSAEHEAQGIFIAEGDKVVRRLLESRFETMSVLLPEKQLDAFRPLLEARPENLTVYLADRNLLEALIGFVFYQGVLAVGKIPPPASLDEILRKSHAPQLLVAVDEVSNAENIGALARNCVAFGATALIVGETSSSPFLRRAVRNSMGAIFQLPVVELKRRRGPRESENELRSRGIPPAEKIRRSRKRCAICGRAASAASPRIRARAARRFRRRIFPAIAASFSAAKATAFPRRFWKVATKRWRFRWRPRWIRSTSARRRRFFFTKRNGSEAKDVSTVR